MNRSGRWVERGGLLAAVLALLSTSPSYSGSRTLVAHSPAIDLHGAVLVFEVCPTSDGGGAPPCQVVTVLLGGDRAAGPRTIGDPARWRYSDPAVTPDGRFLFATRIAKPDWRRRLSNAPSQIVRVDATSGAEVVVFQGRRRSKVLLADTAGDRDVILVSEAGRFELVVAPTSVLHVVAIDRESPNGEAVSLEHLAPATDPVHSPGAGVVFEAAFPAAGGTDASLRIAGAKLGELASGVVGRFATIDQALEHVHDCSFAGGNCSQSAKTARTLAAMSASRLTFLGKNGGDWTVAATLLTNRLGGAVFRPPVVGQGGKGRSPIYVGVQASGELRQFSTGAEAVRFASQCDDAGVVCRPEAVEAAAQRFESMSPEGAVFETFDTIPPGVLGRMVNISEGDPPQFMRTNGARANYALAGTDATFVAISTEIDPQNRLRIAVFRGDRAPLPLAAEAEIDLTAVIAEAF